MALVVTGCSLDRSAIAGSLDSGIIEPLDSGQDPGVDAFVPPGEDGGPVGRDASLPPACTARCVGDVAVVCSPTGEVMFDCALADAICESSAGSARCTGGACESPACSSDGTAALQCASGIPATPMPCDRGCAGGICSPESECSLPVAGTIRPGESRMLDLCGTLDDGTHSGCGGNDSTGEDVLLRLDVSHHANYRIEVRDVDTMRAVDPVLYVRKACDDPSSEVACDDDSGPAALDAREDVMLDAAEYFLFVDSFDWNDGPTMYRCGRVEVSVTER